jgi:hypothetical protein
MFGATYCRKYAHENGTRANHTIHKSMIVIHELPPVTFAPLITQKFTLPTRAA